jgi:hypothetical protein
MKKMSNNIQFKPDFEYKFQFRKPNFEFILKVLGLLIEYEFDKNEISEMKISLQETDNESTNNWIGGLHYGKKDVLYLKFAQNLRNKEMIFIFIAADENLKEQIEFIDVLQSNYLKLFKY